VLFDTTQAALEATIAGASQRQQALASNLANANTPGYQRVDVDFHSIYFREPSGVLFEIADDGPGFTVDVPLEQLGSVVILPPQLESRRREIEARLTPLPDPRAGWLTKS